MPCVDRMLLIICWQEASHILPVVMSMDASETVSEYDDNAYMDGPSAASAAAKLLRTSSCLAIYCLRPSNTAQVVTDGAGAGAPKAHVKNLFRAGPPEQGTTHTRERVRTESKHQIHQPSTLHAGRLAHEASRPDRTRAFDLLTTRPRLTAQTTSTLERYSQWTASHIP